MNPMNPFILLLCLTLEAVGAFVRSSARCNFAFSCAAMNDGDESESEKADIAMQKATKAMTAFSNKYLEISDTKLCADKSVAAVVIKGLAEHKVALGSPLCPCRFYDDKEKEAKDGYWNCPCVPMRERRECHCMLFLTEDNAFAGDEVKISYDEVISASEGIGS